MIEQGFLDLVAEASEGRLWTETLYSKKVTAYFTGRLNALEISRVTVGNARRVFHSLRSSVITKARAHNETILVQRVVGHEQTYSSVTDRYIGL